MGLVAMTTLKASWVGIYHRPEGVSVGEREVVRLVHGFGCQEEGSARVICFLFTGSHQSLCIYQSFVFSLSLSAIYGRAK